jgi:3-oxoacyl-[acyl-carrier protein] reductase
LSKIKEAKMEIKGKVAVITGASRGIGRSIALLLAEKGAKIAVIYNTSIDKAQKVKEEVLKKNTACNIYKCDVADFKQSESVVKEIIKDFERVDILVNNAGIAIKEEFIDTKEETWDKTIDVNLKGMFNFCRFIIPYMLRNGKGKIVNLSSIAGRNGGTLGIPYAASKAGVIGLTEALATEFTPRGILINAIAPGPVYTDLTKNLSEEALKKLEKLSPVGRFAYPEEIAQTVVFLIENDYISGEVINVNAGRYMN